MEDSDLNLDFPTALRAAIQTRGVTLGWLSRRLGEAGRPISIGALSYWRSGRRRPEHQTSLEALATLEDLLGVERGHLSARLGRSQRPEPAGRYKRLDELMNPPQAVRAALQAVGDRDNFVEVSTHVIADIDADGAVRQLHYRTLWRARRGDVDRIPFVFTVEDEIDGQDEDGPVFECVRGCRLGQTHHDRQNRVYGVELLLGTAPASGTTCVTEHSVRVLPDATDTRYLHNLQRRMSELMIWVHFHPDRPPARVEALGDLHEARLLPLQGDGSAHHVVRNVGPGKVGVQWFWA